ncbi:hypothetical protein LINPERHAP1_LOCUS25772 [Linum perenne]
MFIEREIKRLTTLLVGVTTFCLGLMCSLL